MGPSVPSEEAGVARPRHSESVEGVAKGRSRADAELGEGAVQMGAYRPVREEHALSDLFVRHPGGRQLRDL
jgi:hypothetical protein